MTRIGMQKFNEIVESIIRVGYEEFPFPFSPDPASLGLSTETPQRSEFGENTYTDDWHALDLVIHSTASWMRDEGYLWAVGQQYRLSRKSLALAPSLVTGAEIPLIVQLE